MANRSETFRKLRIMLLNRPSTLEKMEICLPSSPVEGTLNGHNMTKTVDPNERPASKWKCVYCKDISKNELDLHSHIQKHWKEDKNHDCPVCEKSFNSVPVLLKHHRSFHQIQCPYCEESAVDKQEIIKHLKSHVQLSEYGCPKCNQMFSNGEILLDHVRTHEKPVRCDICGKSFRKMYDLRQHTPSHTNLKPYSCLLCSSSFSRKPALNEHIYLSHTDNIPLYECTECGKSYKQKHQLRNHVNRHSGQTPYSCDICNRKFHDASTLSSHGKTHEKPTKCAHCPKLFQHAYSLREHELTHGNPQLLSCAFCDKKFATRRQIREHVRRHVVPLPECPSCKKTFASVSYMQQHYMAMHDGGGDHVCNICDRKFVMKTHLEAHSLLHREEKPYKCHLCPYACRTRSNLPKHIRIHKKREERSKKES